MDKFQENVQWDLVVMNAQIRKGQARGSSQEAAREEIHYSHAPWFNEMGAIPVFPNNVCILD